MSVIYDNGGATTTNANDLPVTVQLTVGAGTNRLLLVATQHQQPGGNPGTPTFNGVAMTQLLAADHSGGGEVKLWALENPASGTHPLTMSIGTYGFVKIMWSSWSGVVPGAAFGSAFSASGSSTAPSTGSRSVPAGGALFAAMVHNYSTAPATVVDGVSIGNNIDGGAGRPYSAARRSNTGAIAWQTNAANPWLVMGVAVLGEAVGGEVTAPTIGTQPANQSVTAPASATFGVTASGTEPLTYQWRRNGADIPGATAASYTTGATSVAGDNGASYTVVVSNAAGSVVSNPATLTVTAAPDTTPPTLTGDIAITALSSTGYTATCPIASDSVGVAGYQFRIGTAGGFTSIANGGRTVVITGRQPGATDTFQMRAFDAAGNFSTALSRTVTLLAAQTSYTLTSGQMFFNTDTGPQANKAVNWSLYYGGQIGALAGITPIEGAGTTNAQGRLVIPNLQATGAALLMLRDADGGVYLENVMVA